MTWWWCLTHGRVEQGDGCPNNQRLGPYGSEQEAASALQRAADRTAAEDARDKAYDEGRGEGGPA